MLYNNEKPTSAGSISPYRLLLPILLVASVTGCAAMEGVNVGANIPLGGIVNVGANKTIGDSPAPAKSPKKTTENTDETTSEEE